MEYGGTWIRKPSNNACVVFIHGFLSDGINCWTNENGTYWPSLLSEEREFEELGIYTVTYHTEYFSGNYSIEDATKACWEYMKLDGVLSSTNIVFVCHSMGGIVARRLYVKYKNDDLLDNLNANFFLLASPSIGSQYATWFKAISKILGNSQANSLQYTIHNDWLNSLDLDFQRARDKYDLKGRELIEDRFITPFSFFWKKPVVDYSTANRYWSDSFRVAKSDHFSIAKPKGTRAEQYQILCGFIIDHISLYHQEQFNPQSRIESVEQSISRIRRSLFNARDLAAIDKLNYELEYLISEHPANVELMVLKHEVARARSNELRRKYSNVEKDNNRFALNAGRDAESPRNISETRKTNPLYHYIYVFAAVLGILLAIGVNNFSTISGKIEALQYGSIRSYFPESRVILYYPKPPSHDNIKVREYLEKELSNLGIGEISDGGDPGPKFFEKDQLRIAATREKIVICHYDAVDISAQERILEMVNKVIKDQIKEAIYWDADVVGDPKCGITDEDVFSVKLNF